MVDILLLQTVSIAIASAGVFVAAIYYILQIRHQNKMRQTDLIARLFSNMISKDWLEAWEEVRDSEITDYGDYKKKHGFVNANQVYLFYDQLGRLLQKGLIDIDSLPLETGQINQAWEKLKPILEGSRKRFNEPKLGSGFEHLYNEVKKREQQASKTK
jgi:hypothetical protein